jgi:predicted Zn-dependent protease
VRLLVEDGYDPFAQAGFLEQLAAKEALERKVAGEQHNPNRVDFFASHPATAQRTKKAIQAARKSGLDTGQGALKEQAYLGRIDGIVYGDTAKEGYIRGRTFSHPELGFTFTVPAGFILANFSDHVEANNKTRAKMILSGDDLWNGGMDRYLSDRWMPMITREAVISNLRDLRALSINGLDAAMVTVNMDTVDGPKIAQLTAIRYGDSTIRIVALSLKTDGKSRNGLNTASQSFRRLTKDEMAALAPFHLRIATVKKSDTIAKLAGSMPLTGFREEQFKTMNGYSADTDMQSGDLVKIVE